jgi:hypothetical protein
MLNTKSLIKKKSIKNIVSEEENLIKVDEDINQKIINEQNIAYDELSINKIDNDDNVKLLLNKPSTKLLINNNLIENNLIENNLIENNVLWDDKSNCYIIYDSNNDIRTITNEDIINYILNNKPNENVKKYIFTINFNSINNQHEYNFIITKFTENIDVMIKLINFIGDSINNYDNINNLSDVNVDKLMIIYYQIIIFMFKNILQTTKYDLVKLSKYSSYLCYKYSTMILKKIMKIDDNNNNIKNSLENLLIIKNNLSVQLTNISSLLNQDKSSVDQTSIDKENTSIEDSLETSDSSQKKYKISNSDKNFSINKLIYLFTEDNKNTDTDINNYQEIEIITENNKQSNIKQSNNKSESSKQSNNKSESSKQSINKSESSKTSKDSDLILSDTNNDTISENLYNFEEVNNIKKTSNTHTKTDLSYNLNSALINSKLIEMNL